MPASRWKNRMASIGISVAINAAILGIMVGILAAPRKPADTTIEVELAPDSHVRIAHVEPPKLKTAIMPAAAPEGKTSTPPRVEPKRSLLSMLFGPPAPKITEASQSGNMVIPHSGPAIGRSDNQPRIGVPSFGSGAGSGFGEHASSTGGGTTGRGPGAPSASGNGNGGTLVGGDGGSKSVVTVPPPPVHQPEARKAEPPAPPKPTPPKPAPQKPEPPKPRGESRSAQAARQPQPAYPSDARDEGVEGAVTLTVAVDTDGRVSDVSVEKGSGDRRLDKAAEKAVKQWIYSPALKDGVPVKASMRVRVEFKLR